MKNFLLLTVMFFTASVCMAAGSAKDIIPIPSNITPESGMMQLTKAEIFYNSPELLPVAKILSESLESKGKHAGKLSASIVDKKGKTTNISLILNTKEPKPAAIIGGGVEVPQESYLLNVGPNGAFITSATRNGILYGIQSLLQMIEAADGNNIELESCTVSDKPRYVWRGFMLDESRHFFGKKKVMELLDMMTYYKLNKFHWHLTDSPAWRIEIKKYPLLTKVGGIGSWSDYEAPVQFYTQDDIKEIVAYAAVRGIDIIPEIDMPGHANAANRAYPEMSGGKNDTPHPNFTFNPGKEEVYTFLTDILKEVTALFPYKYIHIGGDEVAFGIGAWKTNPEVQALMKREGFTDLRQAELYFVKRMSKVVDSLGKRLIGWDELVDINADPKLTSIMWWRHDRVPQLDKTLKGGYEAVMCPRVPLYFDFVQHKSHKSGRVWGGAFSSIDLTYAFPDSLLGTQSYTAPELEQIMGIQANLWTERVHNMQRFDFMIYPRICALAESAWSTAANKNYTDFQRRLNFSYDLFKRMGLYYFDHRDPSAVVEPIAAESKGNQGKNPLDE